MMQLQPMHSLCRCVAAAAAVACSSLGVAGTSAPHSWPALRQPPPQSAHHFRPVAAATALQVYAQDAEQLARQGDKDAAAASYTKCRDAALECGDLTAAAAAAHHLGFFAQQGGNWQQALEHQR